MEFFNIFQIFLFSFQFYYHNYAGFAFNLIFTLIFALPCFSFTTFSLHFASLSLYLTFTSVRVTFSQFSLYFIILLLKFRFTFTFNVKDISVFCKLLTYFFRVNRPHALLHSSRICHNKNCIENTFRS